MVINSDSMHIRQLIVSSSGSQAIAPNRLVSRSAGIDDGVVEFFCRWCPDRNGLAYGRTESINFIQIDQNCFGLSRSVVGGLECHRDRGRQVVTHCVVIDREQMEGYQYNAAKLARVLLSMGALILRTDSSVELSMLSVPRSSFGGEIAYQESDVAAGYDRLFHAIEIHGSAVVLGVDSPLEYLDGLLMAANASKRLEIGFATGLRVVDDRPIPLQFFKETNPVLVKDLARRQHRTISLESKQVVR